MATSLVVVLVALLGGAALSLALRNNRASGFVALGSQAIATIVMLALVVPVLGGGELQLTQSWSPPVDSITFRIDPLAAFFLAWSLPMTLLGTLYATGYLQSWFQRGRHGGPHFALLNMVSLSFVIIYTVQNALVFLLGWEIAALSAWLLVIWDYRNQKIRFAGFNYLVSTHVGLFVLVAAFMLLHSRTESMSFASFARFLAEPGPMRATIFLLLGVSFALKSAFFPFHTWLPRAHAAAPAHVSALMSGVIHKAGLFGFLRFTLFFGRPDEWMGWTVLGFGALSAFFGVLSTTTQRDLKRLLGYSSTENVGIAAMGFGVGYLGWAWGKPELVALGFAGGLFHLLNHAFFKCLLFYAAGSVYRATHTVDLERLGGLAKKLPLTAGLFLLGGLAISALPPFNGFLSEFLIYAGLFSVHGPSNLENVALVTAAAALAFVGAVSAFATTRAFGVAFLGAPREETLPFHGEAPRQMQVPMLLHAGGALLLGLVPEAALALIGGTVRLFPVEEHGATLLQPLSGVIWASRLFALGLAAAAAIAWWQGRGARRSVTWGCGYTAPTARMQYSASSFAEHFARVFDAFLPALRREKRPVGPLPQQEGHLATHHGDAVEQRMYEVLGQAEDFVVQSSDRIPEQPRFAFAAGLLVLVVIGALVFGGVTR